MERISGIGRWFAVVAIAEAFTWAGLLAGMYLKHVSETTALGVAVFGRLHGAAFIVYLVVASIAWIRLRWGLGTFALVLVAAVPPLVTLPLEAWMRRTGRLAPRDDASARAVRVASTSGS
ncbi:DUF3817 domain-containing protein [Demequina pelophila]|uniref:DUF3817 domain-containing protein n=1 Tax=Demequina pelophila TaxID=1638984 RepID=UPI000B038A49|nr:DUF3817 domain-containing protein [Demequina pelophila]